MTVAFRDEVGKLRRDFTMKYGIPPTHLVMTIRRWLEALHEMEVYMNYEAPHLGTGEPPRYDGLRVIIVGEPSDTMRVGLLEPK